LIHVGLLPENETSVPSYNRDGISLISRPRIHANQDKKRILPKKFASKSFGVLLTGRV
jgi:hypothetical protein